jgi:hypothetical protein
MEPDLTPLPVYEAVKKLGASPPAVNRGYSQEDHWALKYQGGWTAVDEPRAALGKMVAAGAAGASVSTLFQGTDLALVVPKGPSLGAAYVEVDGSADGANRLRHDAAGRAFLDLSSPETLWQQQVPIAAGLSNGPHSLVLISAGPFALDGLIVDAHDPPLWLRAFPFFAMGVVLVGYLVLAVVVSRRRRANA